VTPAEQQKFAIGWSLKLTNEGGFIVALLSGLVIANFFPRVAEWLKEAIRPELYIKIAIVILGATVAVTAAGRLNLASSLLVAGAWIGLAIKTDGAAVAGGGITESLIMAKAAAEGIKYQPGWILATTTTVKIFIDIFIGIWAFILGYIWTNYIDRGPDKAKP